MLCPCCERNGRISYIRTLQVGFDEALQLCEQDDCTYPELGDDVPLLVKRSVKDSIASDIANLAKFVDLEKHGGIRRDAQQKPKVAASRRSTCTKVTEKTNKQFGTVAKSVTNSDKTSQPGKQLDDDENTSKSKRKSSADATKKLEISSKRSKESNASSECYAPDVRLSALFGDLDDAELDQVGTVANGDSFSSLFQSRNEKSVTATTALVPATATNAKKARTVTEMDANVALFSRPRSFDCDSIHPQFTNAGDSTWFDSVFSLFLHFDFPDSDQSPLLVGLRDEYAAIRAALRNELSRAAVSDATSNDRLHSLVTVTINANLRVGLRPEVFSSVSSRIADLRDSTLEKFLDVENQRRSAEAFSWFTRSVHCSTEAPSFSVRFSSRSRCSTCAFSSDVNDQEVSVLRLANFGARVGERCTFPHNVFSLTRCESCGTSDQTFRCDTRLQRLGRFFAVSFEQSGVVIGSSGGFADAMEFTWQFEEQQNRYRYRYRVVSVLQQRPNHVIGWVRDRKKGTWMECDSSKGLCASFNRLQPACPLDQVQMLIWQRDDEPLSIADSTSNQLDEVEGPLSVRRVATAGTNGFVSKAEMKTESQSQQAALCNTGLSLTIGDADEFLTAAAPSDLSVDACSQPRASASVGNTVERTKSKFTWLRDSPLLTAARNRPASAVGLSTSIRSTDVSPATSSSSVGSQQFGSTSSGYVSVCGSSAANVRNPPPSANEAAAKVGSAASKISKVSLVCGLLKERGVKIGFETSSRAFPAYKPTATIQQDTADSQLSTSASACVASQVKVPIMNKNVNNNDNDSSVNQVTTTSETSCPQSFVGVTAQENGTGQDLAFPVQDSLNFDDDELFRFLSGDIV